jgi:hypothetical protein
MEANNNRSKLQKHSEANDETSQTTGKNHALATTCESNDSPLFTTNNSECSEAGKSSVAQQFRELSNFVLPHENTDQELTLSQLQPDPFMSQS